jgi:Mce-associated membrane protein
VTSNTEAATPRPKKTQRPKNKSRPVLVALSIVAVVALAACVWFGIGWKSAWDEKAIADTRDSALNDARQAAINLSTVDSADMDGSLDLMLTSVTGDQMTSYLEETKKAVTDEQRNSGRKITAEVLDATITELNVDDRTATAIAIVANNTSWPDGFTERTRSVMRMYLEEVDGTWKVNNLLPVGDRVPLNPVDAPADPGVQQPDAGATDPSATDPSATDPSVTPPSGEPAPADSGATEGP